MWSTTSTVLVAQNTGPRIEEQELYINVTSASALGKKLALANSSLVAKGETNPICGSMLLSTGADGLHITVANTSSHQLKLHAPAHVNVPGSVLVPGDHFTKVMNRLGDRSVSMKVENSQLVAVTSDNDVYKFDLFQGEADDFPIDGDLPPVGAIVDADGFTEALKSVLTAALDAEQDIIFKAENSTLSIYTSDYLTTKSRTQLASQNFPFSFTVPRSTVAAGRIPDWSGPVQIHVRSDKVVLSQGDEHLMIRRVGAAGDVQTIEDILSIQPMGRLVVSRQQLQSKVHVVAIGKQTCTLQVKGKNEKNLLIEADNAGVGGHKQVVAIQGAITGVTGSVKVDVTLLEKALKTVDGDDLLIDYIDYTGDGSSVSLRLANDANPEKKQTLLLPLQG